MAHSRALTFVKRNKPSVCTRTCNASLATLSALGILPLWVKDHVELDDKPHWLSFFQGKPQNNCFMNKVDAWKFLKTVNCHLSKMMNKNMSLRWTENLFFNFVLKQCPGMETKIHIASTVEETVFNFSGTKVQVLHADGSCSCFHGNLICAFPFGKN